VPTWVPVVLTISITLLTIAERFYVRFVPEIEVQKRHLKKFAVWIASLGGIAIQIYFLYQEAHGPSPVNPTQAVRISLVTGAFVLNLVAIFTIRTLNLIDRFLDVYLRGWKVVEKTVHVTERHNAAIMFLAEQLELAPDIQQKLDEILVNREN